MSAPLLVERADTKPIHLPALRHRWTARAIAPHMTVIILVALNVTMLTIGAFR